MNGNTTSDYIFKAYVVNTQAYDTGERDAGAWLYFPPYAEDIFSLFEKSVCRPTPRRICISWKLMCAILRA